MNYPFPLYDLPEGYELVDNFEQLCKLKQRKRKFIPSNLTPRLGMIIFVYSEIKDKYYRRILQSYTGRKFIEDLIQRRILYYKPSEHGKSQIHKIARRSDFSRISS